MLAKQKLFDSLHDRGFNLKIDKNYKWHESHKDDDKFTDKLNLSNVGTL